MWHCGTTKVVPFPVRALALLIQNSDPHGHNDVAVFVVVAFGGAELAGGLGVFEFEADFAGAGGFEEVDKILGVEADGQRLAGVGGFDGIFGLAGFRGGGGELEFAFFEAQADGTYAATNGHQVTSFNGNDTVFLLKSGVVIDAIGATTDLASGGTGPALGWGAADASGTMLTVDHTLRRKAGIGRGTPSLDETWDPTVEWDILAKDTFTGLGQR